MTLSQDAVLTLTEYLQKETELEEEAAAVLPGRFDKCTYDQGYLKQALYVCRTCLVDESNGMAAICYSCSVSCHPKCELIELSYRRNFRCDCGNANFKSTCCLHPDKDTRNTLNNYEKSSHNFYGRFCTCDQEFKWDEEQTCDMIQCLICEDWLHEGCIGEMVPPSHSFDEFICKNCVKANPWIQKMMMENIIFNEYLEHNIDVVSDTIEEEPDSKRCKSPTCIGSPNADTVQDTNNAVYLAEGWRDMICRCHDCESFYVKDGLEYLWKKEIVFEPEEDEEVKKSPEELMKSILETSLDRDKLLNGIKAVDNLGKKLVQFLKPLAGENRIVTKEDIENFFTLQYQNP